MGKIQRCTIPTVFNRCKTKKRNFWLNLNQFVQVSKHTHQRNAIKKMYSDVVRPHIRHLEPITGRFRVTYTLYRSDKTKFDIDNLASVLSKFFMDVLVQDGIIEDDNYEYFVEMTVKWGGVRDNTADVEIEEM